MTRDRKKWIVLACLVILWVVLILVQRSQVRISRPTRVSSVSRSTPARRGGPASHLQKQARERSKIPRLKLSLAERVRPPFEPEARNIFALIEPSSAFRPTPPAKPQVVTTPPIPPPLDPFVEEAKKVRFLGYAEADGKAMAFVVYQGEALVVPEAGSFGRLFQVKKVKEDVLILSSTDGTKEVQVKLGLGSNALPNPGRGPRPGTTPPNRGMIQRGKQP